MHPNKLYQITAFLTTQELEQIRKELNGNCKYDLFIWKVLKEMLDEAEIIEEYSSDGE